MLREAIHCLLGIYITMLDGIKGWGEWQIADENNCCQGLKISVKFLEKLS